MEKTTLQEQAQSIRDEARNTLRMELVNNRLANISRIKLRISQHENDIKDLSENGEVHDYELMAKLDENHPKYAESKEVADKTLAQWKEDRAERIESKEKTIEKLEEDIKKEEEGIALIESGETKISLDRLNSVSTELINKKLGYSNDCGCDNY